MPTERRVLFWMCVLVAVNQLGFGSVLPVLPLYAKSFGVSASAIGLSVAAYGLARMFVSPPCGQLADRFGRRPTLAIGGLITALGNLWCALASSYPEFVAARFIAGAGAGIVITAGQIVLADITTPERRGRVIAIYQGTFIFAVGIGPLPGGVIADHLGLAAPFLSYAFAGVVLTGVAWLAVPETRELARMRSAATAIAASSWWSQASRLLRQIGYLLVCCVSLVNALARTGGLFCIVPVFGAVRLGLSVSQIGLGLAVGSFIGAICAYPAGMLVDRFGRKTVIAPATTVSGISMLLFCFAPSYPWFFAACLVWSVATSIGGAAPATYAADSALPGTNATTMSLFRMVGDIGYVVGPIILGLIVDWYSPEISLIVASGLLILMGILFSILAPETYRGRKR